MRKTSQSQLIPSLLLGVLASALLVPAVAAVRVNASTDGQLFVRVNQLGYRPGDSKILPVLERRSFPTIQPGRPELSRNAGGLLPSLKGISITEPDPLAQFQDERAVYHDDVKDYSTNEPTMDGTASAILMWAVLASL